MNAMDPVELCMVIGEPVDFSLSPFLHNTGYKLLGIESQYYFFKRNVPEQRIGVTIDAVRSLGIRGVSVTAPLKQAVMPYLDEIDEAAQEIGAVNTIVNSNGKLRGYNTDWIGIQKPLARLTTLKGKKVAILGAGGAARAAVYAIRDSAGSVTVMSRSIEHAGELASQFGLYVEPITQLTNIGSFDIILLAVPSGKNQAIKRQLSKHLRPGQLLFNFAYAPDEAIFLRTAETAGVETIDGYAMLLSQALEQFKLFTGMNAPEDKLRAEMSKYIRSTTHG